MVMCCVCTGNHKSQQQMRQIASTLGTQLFRHTQRQHARCFSSTPTKVTAPTLSHVTSDGQPTMVDVSHKRITTRTATAQALVWLPQSVIQASRQFGGRDGELLSKKGAVFHTAIIAGTMAVKRTSDLIPFCHPLQIQKCKLDIRMTDGGDVGVDHTGDADGGGVYVVIECTVGVDGKTGVEMEAIVGASTAAMTVYDMCKAASHAIEIRHVKLVKKTGGKSDYGAV